MMTAPQKFAKLVLANDPKATRIANLVAQGHSIAKAIRYVEIASKENYR